MNQQEFDARSIQLKAEMDRGLAQVRKERDIDQHGHTKALNKIALQMADGNASPVLMDIKQCLMDSYFDRDQLRKEREDAIRAEYAQRKAQLIAEYGQWMGSRKSNREANRELWLEMHRTEGHDDDYEAKTK